MLAICFCHIVLALKRAKLPPHYLQAPIYPPPSSLSVYQPRSVLMYLWLSWITEQGSGVHGSRQSPASCQLDLLLLLLLAFCWPPQASIMPNGAWRPGAPTSWLACAWLAGIALLLCLSSFKLYLFSTCLCLFTSQVTICSLVLNSVERSRSETQCRLHTGRRGLVNSVGGEVARVHIGVSKKAVFSIFNQIWCSILRVERVCVWEERVQSL